jgi:hypothetical protein
MASTTEAKILSGFVTAPIGFRPGAFNDVARLIPQT